MAALDDIRSAFALLTVLPGPRAAEEPSPRLVAYFPWVGLALGGAAIALLAVADSASATWGDGRFLARAAWPCAVLIIVLWAAATRMLHWDGLADVTDAWWGGHTRERRLAIMADSSVGAFGATAIVLVALAEVASVAVLLGSPGFGTAIFAAPVFGRAAAMFGAWLGRAARPGGLGSRVMGAPTIRGIVTAALGLALAGGFMLYEHGVAGAVWSVGAFFTAAAVPHVLSGRFGGVTGDVLGASVLLTETIVLLAAALVVSW